MKKIHVNGEDVNKSERLKVWRRINDLLVDRNPKLALKFSLGIIDFDYKKTPGFISVPI